MHYVYSIIVLIINKSANWEEIEKDYFSKNE